MTSQALTRESVLDLLQRLISIPSVNPVLAPDEGTGELAIAEFACGWLKERGIDAWIDEIEGAPGRVNVVAETGRGAGPTLVGCAHIDTVHTRGMTISPFEPRIEGSRVYGRGSYDMKGGVAALMAAAAALHTDNIAGKFMVALVADEEYASIGAQDFVKRYRADACVVTEPTEHGMQELVMAHKGFVWLEVVTTGVAAHGSRWDLGVSAIAKMGRIISELHAYDRDVLRQRTHPLLGPASMHCALIAGGSGLSTYADECRLSIERRSLPDESPEQVLAEISTIVGDDGHATITLARPPLFVSDDSRIAHCARAAMRAVTGVEPTVAGVGYWMDAALFAGAGMDTLNFGSRGAGAHEPVEWVDLDTVVQCAQALYQTGVNYCGI